MNLLTLLLALFLLPQAAVPQNSAPESKETTQATTKSGTSNPRTARGANKAPASKSTQDAESGTFRPREEALRLVERSYALDDQLSLSDRVTILNRQINLASRLDRQKGRDWSAELLELSRQLPDADDEAQVQGRLVESLSGNDTEYALEIFRTLPAPVAGSTEDGRRIAASALFSSIIRTKGQAGVTTVHEEALRLGSEDAYPYSVMTRLGMLGGRIRALPGSFLTPDSSLILQTFQEALDFYSRSRRSVPGDLDFAMMLQGVNGLPEDLQRSAIRMAVPNLIGSATELDAKNKTIADTTGETVPNLADRALFRLNDLTGKFAPELLDQIKLVRPSATTSLVAPATPADVMVKIDTDLGLSRIRPLALKDPNKALPMAQALTDDRARAQALSMVASGLAAQDPDKANQLYQQASTLASNLDDKEAELKVIILQAEGAARTKNSALLRQSIARGFVLGDQVIRADQDANPNNVTAWRPLAALMRTSLGSELDLTIAYIDALSVPVAKANLLLMAAESLGAGNTGAARRIPDVRQE